MALLRHSKKSVGLDDPGRENLALDLIRRDKIFRNKENEISHLMEQISADPEIAHRKRAQTVSAMIVCV